MAKGSWPGVPGTLLDISEPLTNAVLQQLCSGSGYGRLVAALEAEPGRCGGLSGPFGVLWRRPGGLLPLIILSSAHGCSEQVGGCGSAPSTVWELAVIPRAQLGHQPGRHRPVQGALCCAACCPSKADPADADFSSPRTAVARQAHSCWHGARGGGAGGAVRPADAALLAAAERVCGHDGRRAALAQ